MGVLRPVAAALYLASMLTAGAASAWRQEIEEAGTDIARDVVVNSAGDVIVVGFVEPSSSMQFAVVKLDGDDGAQLWRYGIAGTFVPSSSGENLATAVAIGPADDVVAVGTLHNAGTGRDFTVVKLSGANGMQLWRTEIDGMLSHTDKALAVAVDGAGDVLAAGYLLNVAGTTVFAVIKLDGDTGAELWRQELAGVQSDIGFANDVTLAVDGAGDVIATGEFGSGPNTEFAVVKLAGADGVEQWRTVDGIGLARSAVVTATGDVVAVGELFDPMTFGSSDCLIMRLAGSDGREVWRRDVGRPSDDDFVGEVVIDGAGDVFTTCSSDGLMKLAGATGADVWSASVPGRALAVIPGGDIASAGATFDVSFTSSDLTVARIDGATGVELWRQYVDGLATSNVDEDRANAVAVDALGNVVAAGVISNGPSFDHAFGVVEFSGADGIVGPVPGRRLTVADNAGNAAARRIVGLVTDRTFRTPLGGSPADPTLNGASITLRNPATLESVTMSLPAGPAWEALGSPPGSRGYKYADTEGLNGPCKLLLVKPRMVRLACLGRLAPIGFSLDETTQGLLELSVQLGNADPQCARFGGTVRRDAGIANPGPRGSFSAVSAPAFVGSCPP